MNPLCNTYDSKSGACTTCYNGYDIKDNNCIIAENKDVHCKKFD